MRYRYYLKYRPPMLGAQPAGFRKVESFGERKVIEDLMIQAWGYVEYDRKLDDKEIEQYELAELCIEQ